VATVRRKPSGKYEVRYRDPDGRQRGQTFRTRTDAKRYAAQVETDLNRADWLDPVANTTTFDTWATSWLKTVAHRKPSTIRSYVGQVNNHLLPAFAGRAIGSIGPGDIEAFHATLTAKGAGRGTIINATTALRSVLQLAFRSGAIRRNPAAGLRLERPPRHEKTFLTAEEVRALAEAMAHPPYQVLIYFAAYTGCRAGEIGALRRRHLDLMRGRVTVAESLSRQTGVGPVFQATKNHKIRTVSLPRFLVNMLADHLAAHVPDQPDALIFVSPTGKPIDQTALLRWHFRPAAKCAGLPEALWFHDLRHTCVALLIAEGAHPLAIKERLGHASITTTLDVYGHLFPTLDAGWSDGLDKAFEKASKTVLPDADVIPLQSHAHRATG
jgi:integrase